MIARKGNCWPKSIVQEPFYRTLHLAAKCEGMSTTAAPPLKKQALTEKLKQNDSKLRLVAYQQVSS